MNSIHNKNGFMSMIGLLSAVVVIGILYYLILARQPSRIDEPTQQMITQSGIDNRSYESTLNSTLRQIKGLEQNQLRGGQDVNLILEEMNRNN